MDIQIEKLKLIEWLVGVNDIKTINELLALKDTKEADWWDEISSEERAEIEEGLLQANKGEVISHEEVKEKYKKWL